MRLFIFALLSFTFLSCGNTTQPEATVSEATTGMHENSAGPIDPKTKVDPVCGMEWDAEWTDYSVYNNDTIRFCGEGCKMAFDARPSKYVTTK